MLQATNNDTSNQGYAPKAKPALLACSAFFGAQNDSAVQQNPNPSLKPPKNFEEKSLSDKITSKNVDKIDLDATLQFYNKTNDSAVYTITH